MTKKSKKSKNFKKFSKNYYRSYEIYYEKSKNDTKLLSKKKNQKISKIFFFKNDSRLSSETTN